MYAPKDILAYRLATTQIILDIDFFVAYNLIIDNQLNDGVYWPRYLYSLLALAHKEPH